MSKVVARYFQKCDMCNQEPLGDLVDTFADIPAADVALVRHERWEKHGSKWQCTGCKVLMSIDGTPQENLLY